MRFKSITSIFAAVLATVAGVVAATLFGNIGAVAVSADSRYKWELHVTKECSHYTGLAGSFCTITSSNLAAIAVGSRVFYDQAAGTPAGMLDSNVVLVAGSGDWAVGRCTLDLSTGRGICSFSDGTGPFAGFHARVDVSYLGGPNYAWNGTYSFDRDPD
jgi:hypothetical protein